MNQTDKGPEGTLQPSTQSVTRHYCTELLQAEFGMHGTALSWIQFYVKVARSDAVRQARPASVSENGQSGS